MGGGGGDTSIDETPEQKELAKIGVERMKHYEDTLKPVEDEFISHAKNIGEGESDLAGGMASADAARAMEGVTANVEDRSIQAGGAPGSGRFAAAVSEAGDATAHTRGMSEVSARQGSEDRRLSALNDVVNVGLGKSTEGQAGLSEVAGRAAGENVADAQREYMQSARMGEGLAQAGGYAVSQMDWGAPSGAARTKGYSAPADGYRG